MNQACNKCGKENEPDARFCEVCGGMLSPQESNIFETPIPIKSTVEEPSSDLYTPKPVVSAYTPSMRKCPYCAEKILSEAVKCRFCGEFLNKPLSNYSSGSSSNQPPQQQYLLLKQYQENWNQSEVSSALSGFNWGAFGLTFFWAISMNQGLWALLSILPFLSWVAAFYLGIKGNELAWTSRSWESVEQFKSTQATWNGCGCTTLVLSTILGIVYWIVVIGIASTSGSYY